VLSQGVCVFEGTRGTVRFKTVLCVCVRDRGGTVSVTVCVFGIRGIVSVIT
jgi:hypothetical protein